MGAIGLILVDHGSRRPESNRSLHEMVSRLSLRRPDLLVTGAHMEIAEPRLSAAVAGLVERGAEHIIVHPYLLAPGRHATIDIPEQVRQVGLEYPEVAFEVTLPLGPHNLLLDIILERAGLL